LQVWEELALKDLPALVAEALAFVRFGIDAGEFCEEFVAALADERPDT